MRAEKVVVSNLDTERCGKCRFEFVGLARAPFRQIFFDIEPGVREPHEFLVASLVVSAHEQSVTPLVAVEFWCAATVRVARNSGEGWTLLPPPA